MPQLIELNTYGSAEGKLTVFEKILPGDIKRAFYIYGVAADQERAKHGHYTTWNALIPVAGSCRITVTTTDKTEHTFLLNQPTQCLILQPGDWHIMDQFSKDAILLVLSNQYYDKNDYITEKP
jgi:hypothetical protein